MATIFKLNDWRTETGYLFVSKYGIVDDKLFVEVTPNETQAIAIKSRGMLTYLARNVNILCVRGGGRCADNDAQNLLQNYQS